MNLSGTCETSQLAARDLPSSGCDGSDNCLGRLVCRDALRAWRQALRGPWVILEVLGLHLSRRERHITGSYRARCRCGHPGYGYNKSMCILAILRKAQFLTLTSPNHTSWTRIFVPQTSPERASENLHGRCQNPMWVYIRSQRLKSEATTPLNMNSPP